MRKISIIAMTLLISPIIWSQVKETTKNQEVIIESEDGTPISLEEEQALLMQMSENMEEIKEGLIEDACKCIDSIQELDKNLNFIKKEISACMNSGFLAFQMGKSLQQTLEGKVQNIELNSDPQAPENQADFNEFQEKLMEKCGNWLQSKLSDNRILENSVSSNSKAMEQYNKGIEYLKKQNYKSALPYFKKAVKFDPNFAFAWDNLGLCYRRENNLDKAIKAYKKSIEIQPDAITPIQNIALAYRMKGDYKQAIKYYNQLPNDDAEKYFGLGQVYNAQHDLNNALHNFCKAYNIYMTENSPFRKDAEDEIYNLYDQYLEKDNKAEFVKILNENNINFE